MQVETSSSKLNLCVATNYSYSYSYDSAYHCGIATMQGSCMHTEVDARYFQLTDI